MMRVFLCLCLLVCAISSCRGGEPGDFDRAFRKDDDVFVPSGGKKKEALDAELVPSGNQYTQGKSITPETPMKAEPDSGSEKELDVIQPPTIPNNAVQPQPSTQASMSPSQLDRLATLLDDEWLLAAIGTLLLAVLILSLALWIRSRTKRLPAPTAPFVFSAKGTRTAFFGDIHGNAPALRAVIEDMAKQSIDRMVCLGDLVGYGAEPDECVDLVRRLRCPTILGNHDHFMMSSDDIEKMNPVAAMSVEWTRNTLRPDNFEFIKRLGLTYAAGNVTAVHAGLAHPEKWGYILKEDAAGAAMALQKTQLCVIGHSHVPALYRMIDGEVRSLTVEPFFRVKLHPDSIYLANAGSVGQPRDRQSKSCWLLHDAKTNEIEFRFVAYDVRAAQERIRASGLPEKNAARLESGT